MSSVQETLKILSSSNMSHLSSEVILESMEEQVVIIGNDFRILWANRASTQIPAIGKSCHEVKGKKEPCERCPVQMMFGSGKSNVVEKWMPCSSGSGKWLEMRTYPISNRSGEIICAFKVGFDITARRLTLEKQKNNIETLERNLQQMKHDIIRNRLESREGANLHIRLSRREIEVLKLVADGSTNPEISQVLSMSPHTVKSHLIHIFNKLGVSDRTQAAVHAIRLGIV